jgi:hypothetical protein
MRLFEEVARQYFHENGAVLTEDTLERMAAHESSLRMFVTKSGKHRKPNSNLWKAVSAIESLDAVTKYEFSAHNKIKVRTPDRASVFEEVAKVLNPLGFEHYSDGSSFGRLQLVDREEGTVYVYVKPPFGQRAADVGSYEEKKIADKANKLFGERLKTKVAGSGHGSDIEFEGSKGKLSVEVKTSLGADFPQFRLRYDTESEKWEPARTENYVKNEAMFEPIFHNYIEEYVNGNCKVNLQSDLWSLKGTTIIGIKQSPDTGDFKQHLQKEWFGNRTDMMLEIPFDSISGYYSSKGDDMIQIGNSGLFALNEQIAAKYDIPSFQDIDAKAFMRVRLKPSMGRNSSTSFVVATKIRGDVKPSPKNLKNEEDLFAVVSTIV